MKASILLNITIFHLVLCVFSQHLLGQGWGTKTEWYYIQYDAFIPNPNDYLRIFKHRDTIIQDRKCGIFYQEYLDFTGGTKYSYRHPKAIILEREIDRINYFNIDEETFHTLYDFSKQKGEVFQTCTDESMASVFDVKVGNIDTILLDEKVIKRMEVSGRTTSGSYSMFGYVYDGLGWVYYLFPVYGAVDPPPGGQLICFKDDENEIQLNDQCSILTKVNETAYGEVDVSFWPNPARDQILINESFKINKIEILDISGSSSLSFENPGHKIDVSDLNSGYYLVNLISKNYSYTRPLIICK